MAQLSPYVTQQEQEDIYGHEMDFAKLYANLYMTADLLRPQLEGFSGPTLVIYGIDEAPHMLVVNAIAKKAGLNPVAGLFSPLIPGLVNGKKMSKSLTSHGANIALSHSLEEAAQRLQTYEPPIKEPQSCMVLGLRRYFLMRAAPEESLCTLACQGCKDETSGKLASGLRDKRRLVQS